MGTFTPERERSQEPGGRLLIELKNGRLSLLTDSDEETKRVLEAVSKRLNCGDLAGLLQ